MSWWVWLILGMTWMTTLQWAYRKGQKQAVLKAADILEKSRWNIGRDLAERLRAEVLVGKNYKYTK